MVTTAWFLGDIFEWMRVDGTICSVSESFLQVLYQLGENKCLTAERMMATMMELEGNGRKKAPASEKVAIVVRNGKLDVRYLQLWNVLQV
jgi:hypothetical protein